jgi:pilus assembly protein CpaC
MKTTFNAIISPEKIYEIKILETFRERLKGLRLFSFIHPECAVAFKAPCALHTFGMSSDIWVIELDSNFDPLSAPRRCPPDSIIFSGTRARWLAEIQTAPQVVPEARRFNHSSALIVWPFGSLIVRAMQCSARIFILALLMLFFSTLASASPKPLTLAVGESKEVKLDEPPRSLDISQPDVIDVQRLGTSNKILVTALRSGSSRLSAYFLNGQTRQWTFQVGVSGQIAESNPSLSSASLLRLAREIQKRAGLDALIDNGRIAIFGQLQNETQFNALADLCLGRDECLPRYSLTPESIRIQCKFLSKFFSENGFAGIVAEPSIGGVVIKGSAENHDSREKLNNYLRSLISRFNNNVTADKTGEAVIETQLTFFRMNMNQLTALGLSTEKKSSDPSWELVKTTLPSLISQIKSGPKIVMNFPDIVLNALAKKGVMQQIAKPTIVTSSGSKSEIQTGGEILFQSSGHNQKFYAQNYGLIATIQPKYNGSGRILQKIDIKLSTPQSNPNPNALSGMDQSLLTTEVSIKPDEPILLTRISQQVSGKSIVKIPILGHIPIIGELFKNREIQAEDTELWITLKSRLDLSTAPEVTTPHSALREQTPQAHWLD